MADPEKMREYADRHVNDLRYYAAGNFVVLATCVILFRFYGDDLKFGKVLLSLAGVLSLWSMAVYAVTSETLRDWTNNNFAEQHFPRKGLSFFSEQSKARSQLWIQFLFGTQHQDTGRVKEPDLLFADVRKMRNKAQALQRYSSIIFLIGLFLFVIANR